MLLLAISASMPVMSEDDITLAEYKWVMSRPVVPANVVHKKIVYNNSAQVRKPPQAKPRQYSAPINNKNILRQLPWGIRQVLKQSNVDTNHMGVFVLRVGDREPMLAYNENAAQSPASVMKLVTTYTALGTLGVSYRWPTEIYSTGHLKGGNLKGNLIIKGYGSPDFKTADLRKMLHQLRRKGVRNFKGNLVFDDTYFQVPHVNPGSFDGKRYETYNAQPNALLFNEKTSRYIVSNVRGRPRIYTPTPARNVRVVNKIRSVKGRCRGRSRSPRMSISSSSKGHVVTFSGRYSKRCGKRSYKQAITDSSSMMYSSIKRMWKKEMGGSINARFVRGRVPQNARLLHRHLSAPLSQIIQKVNKDSNNLMARQIMLTIGARRLGAPSNPRKSEQAIKQWLASVGLKFNELRIENGSGLSRWSRISTRHVGELLLHAYNGPYRQYFSNSLAIAGKDGTIKRRFRRSPVAGKGRFKTGSLRDARGIAGYVRGIDGHDYIVSILHNGKAARRRGKRAHDALIEWAYWRGKPPQKLAKR